MAEDLPRFSRTRKPSPPGSEVEQDQGGHLLAREHRSLDCIERGEGRVAFAAEVCRERADDAGVVVDEQNLGGVIVARTIEDGLRAGNEAASDELAGSGGAGVPARGAARRSLQRGASSPLAWSLVFLFLLWVLLLFL